MTDNMCEVRRRRGGGIWTILLALFWAGVMLGGSFVLKDNGDLGENIAIYGICGYMITNSILMAALSR